MKIYLVGGAVRDELLGLAVKDRDWVVTGATPEVMHKAGYKPVGQDFPVFLHPRTGEEYALARTERKSGRGYAGFVFHTAPSTTLEQDLLRRDLTINAMARDEQGTLIDPFDGYKDLQERILASCITGLLRRSGPHIASGTFCRPSGTLGFHDCREHGCSGAVHDHGG